MKIQFPIYEFRLLPGQLRGKVSRYANGRWVPGDGEYDLAFAVIGDGPPMCYYVELPYRQNILWSWARDGNWAGRVAKHPEGNAWHYMLKRGKTEWGESWRREEHPNLIAHGSGMDYVASRCGCANGDGPEFHIADEWIQAGLVREAKTKKVVVFPKRFDCMYCGPLKVTDKRLTS